MEAEVRRLAAAEELSPGEVEEVEAVAAEGGFRMSSRGGRPLWWWWRWWW